MLAILFQDVTVGFPTLFVVLQCYLLYAVLNTKASEIAWRNGRGLKLAEPVFLHLLVMLLHDKGEAYNPFWKIITTKHRPCSLFHVRLACMLVWFAFIEEDVVGFSSRCFSKSQPYSATKSTWSKQGYVLFLTFHLLWEISVGYSKAKTSL